MLTKDDMTALEAAIRSSLLARKKELSMSDDALGKMAFAFMANPRFRLYLSVREQEKKGSLRHFASGTP